MKCRPCAPPNVRHHMTVLSAPTQARCGALINIPRSVSRERKCVGEALRTNASRRRACAQQTIHTFYIAPHAALGPPPVEGLLHGLRSAPLQPPPHRPGWPVPPSTLHTHTGQEEELTLHTQARRRNSPPGLAPQGPRLRHQRSCTVCHTRPVQIPVPSTHSSNARTRPIHIPVLSTYPSRPHTRPVCHTTQPACTVPLYTASPATRCRHSPTHPPHFTHRITSYPLSSFTHTPATLYTPHHQLPAVVIHPHTRHTLHTASPATRCRDSPTHPPHFTHRPHTPHAAPTFHTPPSHSIRSAHTHGFPFTYTTSSSRTSVMMTHVGLRSVPPKGTLASPAPIACVCTFMKRGGWESTGKKWKGSSRHRTLALPAPTA
eukprot:365156-Chlamydomonas_euryale.AAC.2